MSRISGSISYGSIENEEGREVDGITAICSECKRTTESPGTSDASKKRCLALMREGCPDGENHLYYAR